MPPSAAGKTIKCPRCATAMRLPALLKSVPESTVSPSGNAKVFEKKTRSPAKPLSVEDELFSDEPTSQAKALENFAAEDFDLLTIESPGKAEGGNVVAAPAPPKLKTPAIQNRKGGKRQSSVSYEGKKFANLSDLSVLAWLITACVFLVPVVWIATASYIATLPLSDRISDFSSETRRMVPALSEQIAFVGFGVIAPLMIFASKILTLVFWAMSYANLRKMQLSGLTFSPGWMVGCWFIPFANLIWPWQGVKELYQASEKPVGNKWKDEPVPALLYCWWAFTFIATSTSLLGTMAVIAISSGMLQEYASLVGFLVAVSVYLGIFANGIATMLTGLVTLEISARQNRCAV